MKKNYSTINIASLLLCMLATFSLLFVSCSDDDEGIRMPDDNEVLTEHIYLEIKDSYVRVIRYDMWGQKGTFTDVEVTLEYIIEENNCCELVFKDINEKPRATTYFLGFYLSEDDMKKLQGNEGKNIIINGTYKYICSEWLLDSPYQGNKQFSVCYAVDYFELKLTDIKLMEE